MKSILKNSNGNAVSTGGKLLGSPESVNVMKTLLDGRKETRYLFYNYTGTSVDDLISYNDTENVTNMQYMFYGCTNLQTIPQLDTSNVADMSNMFYNCLNLQTIPQLNTSNATNMQYMFYRCQNLQTIPQLDTSKVNTNMANMFYQCYNLQTIPQLDTSNATSINSMFYQCYKLQTIDLTSLDKISSAMSFGEAAYNCYSLTKFIIRTMTKIPPLNNNSFTNCYHFKGQVNSTYNPSGLKDGRIYVPDDYVESLKSATNWSTYADIIVPLSTLGE